MSENLIENLNNDKLKNIIKHLEIDEHNVRKELVAFDEGEIEIPKPTVTLLRKVLFCLMWTQGMILTPQDCNCIKLG